MSHRRLAILNDRVLSLEARVQNFEYARKRLEDLRRNADALEVAQYEQALAKNSAALESLRRELNLAREELFREHTRRAA
jgi:DUF438 domain-containing protein